MPLLYRHTSGVTTRSTVGFACGFACGRQGFHPQVSRQGAFALTFASKAMRTSTDARMALGGICVESGVMAWLGGRLDGERLSRRLCGGQFVAVLPFVARIHAAQADDNDDR